MSPGFILNTSYKVVVASKMKHVSAEIMANVVAVVTSVPVVFAVNAVVVNNRPLNPNVNVVNLKVNAVSKPILVHVAKILVTVAPKAIAVISALSVKNVFVYV